MPWIEAHNDCVDSLLGADLKCTDDAEGSTPCTCPLNAEAKAIARGNYLKVVPTLAEIMVDDDAAGDGS